MAGGMVDGLGDVVLTSCSYKQDHARSSQILSTHTFASHSLSLQGGLVIDGLPPLPPTSPIRFLYVCRLGCIDFNGSHRCDILWH